MKKLFEDIDFDFEEDWEEEEPIDNKNFIMYFNSFRWSASTENETSVVSLCYLIKKSYIGNCDSVQVWNVDNRNSGLTCYIRFHKVKERLRRYATNDEIDKYLNKNKLDYLLSDNITIRSVIKYKIF